MFTHTASRPSVCFSAPLPSHTRRLARGGTQTFRFSGESPVSCETALPLVVGSRRRTAADIRVGGVDSMTLRATGPAADLQGASGQIMLTPVGRHRWGHRPRCPRYQSWTIARRLAFQSRAAVPVMGSTAATSALTDGGGSCLRYGGALRHHRPCSAASWARSS
jgi:hypothetical protein